MVMVVANAKDNYLSFEEECRMLSNGACFFFPLPHRGNSRYQRIGGVSCFHCGRHAGSVQSVQKEYCPAENPQPLGATLLERPLEGGVSGSFLKEVHALVGWWWGSAGFGTHWSWATAWKP